MKPIVRFRAQLFLLFLVTLLLISIMFGTEKLGDSYFPVTPELRNDQTLFFTNQTIHAQVAKTPDDLDKGLSGIKNIVDSEGMLFVSETADLKCFWMKDMNFDIDIMWFDEAKKLVHIEKSVSPNTYPTNFCSDKSVPYVLEVLSGFVDREQIKLGDEFRFSDMDTFRKL